MDNNTKLIKTDIKSDIYDTTDQEWITESETENDIENENLPSENVQNTYLPI